MLKTFGPKQKIGRDQYRAGIEPLKERLAVLQHQVKNAGLPVMLVFEGWAAAGKGMVLADVLQVLDPRNFTVINTQPPNCVEAREPFLWRHWRSMPPKGRFSIYDRSWYPEAADDYAAKKADEQKAARRVQSIQVFERQMADDGVLVIKFFLHIGQKQQAKRLKALVANKNTAWRVTGQDWKNNKHYSRYLDAWDTVLQQTDAPHAPWHLVAAHQRRATLAQVYTVLVAQLEAGLAKPPAPRRKKAAAPPLQAGPFTLLQTPQLREVDLSQQLEEEDYKQRLKKGRKRLGELHNLLYQNKIPLIIGYEGWDAAGKGGNILRLTSGLDPRGYEVVPIASPTQAEKARQHLWRFWQALPKNGHIAVFDRTWYGRVLVERIEGFATETEWRRAYRELNEFEAELAHWGAIVLKYWLHIGKDEQLRRFEARQSTPEKQWKITDEDWRNREKWDDYKQAVDDMLRLTSTEHAPWHVIESQNKRYGRVKAIEITIAAIENKLQI